jgi:NifB/MoaA-like Fe-S oxidoreductase
LGLTRYNTDPRLTAVTPEFCRQTISEVTSIQREFRKQLGTTFAFLGDEIYLRAGSSVPARSHYGNYPQIEDGIGMVRSFNSGFTALVKRLERNPLRMPVKLHGTILTGILFAPVLKPLIEDFNIQFGTRLHVEGVENTYFGGDVSVAGLLTGGDLLSEKERLRGDFVIIPGSTLKSDEDIMLDGMKLEELSQSFGLPVYPFDLKSFGRFLFPRN